MDITSLIKKSEKIIVSLDDNFGAIICEHKVINFTFDEIESPEDMIEIMSKAKQVKYGAFDVPKSCVAYEYNIFNDGEYEFASHSSIYHKLFFSKEEFDSMVQKAIDAGCDSEWDVAGWLRKNKGFFHIQRGQSVCVDNPWRKEHEHLENKFQILYG